MPPEATYPYHRVTVPPLLYEPITERRAWKRETLSPADCLVPLPPACANALDGIVRFVRASPRPVWHLTPDAFALRACTGRMAQVCARLYQDTGVAVIDRVPVERYSPTETRTVVGLLASLVGQMAAQSWDGSLPYDLTATDQYAGRKVRLSRHPA